MWHTLFSMVLWGGRCTNFWRESSKSQVSYTFHSFVSHTSSSGDLRSDFYLTSVDVRPDVTTKSRTTPSPTIYSSRFFFKTVDSSKVFLTVCNELPEESDQFRFHCSTCLSSLKGSVGLILAKASGMRISIPLDLSSRFLIPLPYFIHSSGPTSLLVPPLVFFPPSYTSPSVTVVLLETEYDDTWNQ